MPLDRVWTRLIDPVGQPQSRHPCADFRIQLRHGASLQLAVVAQDLADRHPLVQAPFLRQIADVVAHGRLAGLPEHPDLPASGTRMFMIIRIVVVFPEPFGPMKP